MIEIKYTNSTNLFYQRRNNDDRTIRRIKRPSNEKFAQTVMGNAPNWVRYYGKEHDDYNKLLKKLSKTRDEFDREKMIRKHISKYHKI